MVKDNKRFYDNEQKSRDIEYFEDEYYYDTRLFKNKRFKRFLLITLTIVILVLLAAFIMEGKNINIIRISNYYFTVGIIVLILSVMVRVFAWSIHKKSVLKEYENSERDMIVAKGKLRLVTKILGFIGFVCLMISSILTFIMLLTL